MEATSTTPKVTLKPTGSDHRKVHVNGVEVGRISRKDYGRFGKSDWSLKLAGMDTQMDVGNLTEIKAAVIKIFMEVK